MHNIRLSWQVAHCHSCATLLFPHISATISIQYYHVPLPRHLEWTYKVKNNFYTTTKSYYQKSYNHVYERSYKNVILFKIHVHIRLVYKCMYSSILPTVLITLAYFSFLIKKYVWIFSLKEVEGTWGAKVNTLK